MEGVGGWEKGVEERGWGVFNYPHLDYFFKSIRKGFEFLILPNQENLDGEWIHLCYKKNCHFCSNDVTYIYIYIYIKLILKSFQKKREESSSCHALLWSCFLYHVMLCLGHALPWSCFHALLHFAMFLLTKSASKTKIFSSTIDSHILKTKREIHYSLSLFIHYCSWHCSLRILAYLRGVIPYNWNKF